MAIPVLKLNLVPPPSLWRRRHELIGWGVLGLGALSLALVLGLAWRSYRQAVALGRQASDISAKTAGLARRQSDLLNRLQAIDVTQEMPRWKLAERILSERSLPWSRLAAELERCLAHEVRLKSIQRTRDNAGQVLLKLKGEAKSRESESAFLEAAQKNPVFAQLTLEREVERQGGGWEFDCTVIAVKEPPPYEVLPKYAKPLPNSARKEPVAPPPAKAQVPPHAPKATPPAPKAAPSPMAAPQRGPSRITPEGTGQAPLLQRDRPPRRPMSVRRPPNPAGPSPEEPR